MTGAEWNNLALPPVIAVVGFVGLLMAMGGMIAGHFVWVLLPIPLLIGMRGLMRGLMGEFGNATWLRSLFGVAALMSVSMMGLGGVCVLSLAMNPPHLLPKTGDGKRAARVEFRFPEVTRVVHDPHGKIRFYHGDAPEVVSLPDGSGMLVFRGAAGLSTWADSASVGEDGFRFGGWMGVTASDKEIRVAKDGSFDDVGQSEVVVRSE